VRVFVDASAWVPMEIASDQWRPAITRVMDGLKRERGLHLVTTNWTLYEALSIVQRRGPAFARMLHRRVKASAAIVTVDEVTERRAVANFLRWADKTASVVDHANTLAAVRYRCDAILSFDADFIPLAAAAGLRVLR